MAKTENPDDTLYPHSKDILSLMTSFGMKQKNWETTRYSSQINTCIDLIFTNCDYISNSGTLDLNISDHQAIFVTKKKQAVKNNKIKFKGRSYRNYSREYLQEILKNEDWSDLENIENPNLAWEFFIDKIV